MTDEQIKHMEGLIIKAVQSGKQETSGLVDEILHKIEPAVAINIEKYVNGHLREIKEHLVAQDVKLDEMDKKIKPMVESRMTVLNIGRFVIWIGAIAGASAGIIWLIEKVRDTQ